MMAAGSFAIPHISLEAPRAQIVQDLRRASLSSGFFQLVDLEAHVPRELILQMFEQTKHFFDLPQEEKEKVAIFVHRDVKAYRHIQVTKQSHLVGGYEGWRFYNLNKTGDGGKLDDKTDDEGGWNEGFAIAPEWGTNCFPQQDPSSNAQFETSCKRYFHAVQELGRHVLGMIAEGLGMGGDFFEGYLHEQNSFCRLTHYYRAEDPNAPPRETLEMGAAPHTDWGALTLLIQDEIGGLQVFDRSNETWHDVPPLPLGTGIVCNIGDLLGRWTNDSYRSTLHRVIAPPRGIHRYSIPFFNPGNPSFPIETIPTCLRPNEQAKYGPITAGEYITMRHLQSTGALEV